MRLQQLIENWIYVSSENQTFLVEEGDNAATANANFLGTNTSDPGASGRDIYSNPQNLPTAIASILNHSQNKANFHPAVDTPEQVASTYAQYIREIDRTPFLHLLKNERTREKYDSNDYNRLINDVVKLYDGISTQDKEKMKSSIADMAKAIFSQRSAENWKNLFSQSTIDYSDPRNPKIFIYYTTLHMKHEDNGKAGVSDHQEFTVNRGTYQVLGDLIIANADHLANLTEKNVDDWLDESSTPERENTRLCFKVKSFAKA